MLGVNTELNVIVVEIVSNRLEIIALARVGFDVCCDCDNKVFRLWRFLWIGTVCHTVHTVWRRLLRTVATSATGLKIAGNTNPTPWKIIYQPVNAVAAKCDFACL